MEEEGQLSEEPLLWGFHMHLNHRERPEDLPGRIRLPEPKCVKGNFMLAQAALQTGVRVVPRKSGQEVAGFFNFASTSNVGIRPELGAIDRMLRGTGPHLNPSGPDDVVEAMWEDWWRALDMLRLALEDPGNWASNFTGAFAALLTPRERLALPGEGRKLHYTGGDATPTRVGSLDWGVPNGAGQGERYYIMTPSGPLLIALRAMPGSSRTTSWW
jgi:hypothetical protein